MCDPITAAIGMGASGAGMGLDAYGQNRGLSAMRDAWSNAENKQRGYDAAINQRTQDMLAQINPQSVTGADQAAELGNRLEKGTDNVRKSVEKAGKRRSGNAEGKAALAQATSGQRGSLINQAQLAAILHGLRSGGQRYDMLGRQHGIDTGIIRGDARTAQSLAPLHERAAGMTGQEWRQLGQLFKMGGQGMTNLGMSQPASAAPTSSLNGMPYSDAGLSEAPIGGWSAGQA